MLPGKKYTPDDILRIALRRKWLIVLPFAVGIIGSQFVARHLPQLYRSETLIQVIPQQIPESIVKSTVTAKLEERLAGDQRTDHEPVAARTDHQRLQSVSGASALDGVMEDVIARMRADIKGPTLVGKESFRLSYVSQRSQDRSESDRASGVAVHRRESARSSEPGGRHQPVPGITAGRREAAAARGRKEAGGLPAPILPDSFRSELPTNLQAIPERADAAAGGQRIDESRARAASAGRAAAGRCADIAGGAVCLRRRRHVWPADDRAAASGGARPARSVQAAVHARPSGCARARTHDSRSRGAGGRGSPSSASAERNGAGVAGRSRSAEADQGAHRRYGGDRSSDRGESAGGIQSEEDDFRAIRRKSTRCRPGKRSSSN